MFFRPLESMELFLWPCTHKSARNVILQRSGEWGLLKMHAWDFPGGPEIRTPNSQCREPPVRSLVREPDRMCCT